MIAFIGFLIIFWYIYRDGKPFLWYWRRDPLSASIVMFVLGCDFGIAMTDLWFYVPADYVPDAAMVERLKGLECTYARCETVVNELLSRVLG